MKRAGPAPLSQVNAGPAQPESEPDQMSNLNKDAEAAAEAEQHTAEIMADPDASPWDRMVAAEQEWQVAPNLFLPEVEYEAEAAA